jgi:leucyl-tRNA synthetase
MVCHETYRDSAGQLLLPDEVEKSDGIARHAETGEPVQVGPSEKMSKSKKNVIAPEAIIERYGADTIRWFMLSDTPPERDIEWTEAGAEGCWRFVQRIHRMVTETQLDQRSKAGESQRTGETSLELRRAAHRAIAHVTDDIEALHFNRAVSRVYELVNSIGSAAERASPEAVRESLEILVKLIGPMMPHLAESCWEALGHNSLLAEEPWPAADPALVRADSVTIAVQVDGKRRGEVSIPRGADEEAVKASALALDGVHRALAGKSPRRIIVVPERIVNIVT